MADFGWLNGLFAECQNSWEQTKGAKPAQVTFLLVSNQSNESSVSAGGVLTYTPWHSLDGQPQRPPFLSAAGPATLTIATAKPITLQLTIGVVEGSGIGPANQPPNYTVDIAITAGSQAFYGTTFNPDTSANILYGTGRSIGNVVLDGAMFLISLQPLLPV